MNIFKLTTLATVVLALAAGSALAKPNFPQTSAQIAADLSNPNNTTFVPSNK